MVGETVMAIRSRDHRELASAYNHVGAVPASHAAGIRPEVSPACSSGGIGTVGIYVCPKLPFTSRVGGVGWTWAAYGSESELQYNVSLAAAKTRARRVASDQLQHVQQQCCSRAS